MLKPVKRSQIWTSSQSFCGHFYTMANNSYNPWTAQSIKAKDTVKKEQVILLNCENCFFGSSGCFLFDVSLADTTDRFEFWAVRTKNATDSLWRYHNPFDSDNTHRRLQRCTKVSNHPLFLLITMTITFAVILIYYVDLR